jgi:hypothetical protein
MKVTKTDAITCAFDDCLRELTGLPAPTFLQRYLSTQRWMNCPTAALVSDITRQPARRSAMSMSPARPTFCEPYVGNSVVWRVFEQG